MSTIESKLADQGLVLPTPAKPVASYVPVVVAEHARLIFVSGQIPSRDGKLLSIGVVPSRVSIEEAQACARQCVLNALAAVKAELGSLERIARVVKLGVFVACDPGFTDQPKVANGASDLLVSIMGEQGRHARAAVGVPALPLGAPVEVDMVLEMKP